MRKILVTIFLLIVASLVLMYNWYQNEINKSLNITGTYQLEIKKGQTLNSVARQLEQDAVIPMALLLKIYAKQSTLGHNIKAGNYELDAQLGIPALLQKLVEGKVALEQITIPEGVTFREMLGLIHADENVVSTLADKTDQEIMDVLGHTDEHPEGRFLPETYRFAKGTNDIALLKTSYQEMQKILGAAWENKSEDSQLQSAYEALILASIIEKETGVFDEQPTIAGVFNSRLRKGMRLQTDPTVIYGLGEAYDGDIRRKDLETDTPYNTYTRSGLPPTPIALPGAHAIKAAVNPEKHNKLYFVATGEGDGRHYFSATLEEHNKAVQRYLRNYRRQHP